MKFFETLKDISIGSLTLAAILEAVLVFIVCLVVIKLAMRLICRALDKSRMEKAARSFIRSASKILLWALAIIIVSDILGIPTASLVAILSVAGLALSLSLQSLLSNLFSGMTLLASRPFKAGDFVQLGTESGTVREISLIHTKILTIDNRVVLIPNGDVTASRITNYSAEPLRRVDLNLSLSYDSPADLVEKALLEAASLEPRVLTEPAAEAHLLSYKDSAVDYVLRAWVKSEDYWDAYFALIKSARLVLEKHGAEMTYNHLNVHISKD